MSSLEDLVTSTPGFDRAFILLGGVTEKGYDSAVGRAKTWSSSGEKVIWFDGWSPGANGPILMEQGLIVVRYSAAERNRLPVRAQVKAENRSASRGDPWAFWARMIRKLNTATRGYFSWRLISGQVRALQSLVEPGMVVYCDDHAATAAWHAARIWPNAPIARA